MNKILLFTQTMNPFYKENLDKLEALNIDRQIKLLIISLVRRIDFFTIFYQKLNSRELWEVYTMFFYTNLLDLYSFADAFKIQYDLNEFNPFFVWCTFFNSFKHIDMAREMGRCDIEKKLLNIPSNELTYKRPDQFSECNNPIFEKLRKKFFNDILMGSKEPKVLIKKSIDKWLEIKDFLTFILKQLPEKDILTNKETEFYKNRFQLWKFYLEAKQK